MIIVTKKGITAENREQICARIRELGLRPEISQGEFRTVIGVIGPEDRLRTVPLQTLPGVEKVLPVLQPYKLAGREFQEADSLVKIGAAVFGGRRVAVIAGPCAVESREPY